MSRAAGAPTTPQPAWLPALAACPQSLCTLTLERDAWGSLGLGLDDALGELTQTSCASSAGPHGGDELLFPASSPRPWSLGLGGDSLHPGAGKWGPAGCGTFLTAGRHGVCLVPARGFPEVLPISPGGPRPLLGPVTRALHPWCVCSAPAVTGCLCPQHLHIAETATLV